MKKDWKTPILAAILSSSISVSAVWAGFLREIPSRGEVRTIVEEMTDKRWFEKLIDTNTRAITALTVEVQNLRIAIAKLEKETSLPADKTVISTK